MAPCTVLEPQHREVGPSAERGPRWASELSRVPRVSAQKQPDIVVSDPDPGV